MVAVEIMMQMKMLLVGPFENQRQALNWIGELVEANPKEKVIIAVNDTSPTRIRVYAGEPQPELPDGIRAPVFDLFR